MSGDSLHEAGLGFDFELFWLSNISRPIIARAHTEQLNN